MKTLLERVTYFHGEIFAGPRFIFTNYISRLNTLPKIGQEDITNKFLLQCYSSGKILFSLWNILLMGDRYYTTFLD